MTIQNEPKTQRAAKRYSYQRTALCEVGGEKIEVQIIDISASGLKFASRTNIESKNPVKISWNDSEFGLIDPTLLVVREIHEPELGDLPFQYGSQYCDLKPITKKNLIALIKFLKDSEKNADQKQIEKISLQYVFDSIKKGPPFLQAILNNTEKMLHFETILNEIKDYEKLSFQKEDPISEFIQKLTAHHFHFNLLGKLLPTILKKEEFQTTYLDHVLLVSQQSSETDLEIDEMFKSIPEDGESYKKTIQKILSESTNRVFYAKQALLQSVTEACSIIDPESSKFGETFDQINKEYKLLLNNITTPAKTNDEPITYKRRSKIPNSQPEAEIVSDISFETKKYTRYFLWIALLLLTVSGVGIMKFFEYQNKISHVAKDEIGLPVKPDSYEIHRPQLELRYTQKAWNDIPYATRKNMFEKIISYLATDQTLQMCIFFNEKSEIIKVIYETNSIEDTMLEFTSSAIQPTPTVDPNTESASPTN